METAHPLSNPAGPDKKTGDLIIAVAGNPNAGKSTLINAIADSRLHVGNWPGVTVEKKSASFKLQGRRITLVDLPGIYSLGPYTQEEIIARDYLVTQKPDVIINVVDATNLERNLYFTIQLIELGIPMVIALNMHDEAQQKGLIIDTDKMSGMLGCAAIPTVATRREGIDRLLETAIDYADYAKGHQPALLSYDDDIETTAKIILEALNEEPEIKADRFPARWLALKLLEGDERAWKESAASVYAPFLKQATRH